MKNLFDYATKELSQDAFLCWLFESWEDADLKEVAFGLLRKFGVSIRSNNIVRIKALLEWKRQWNTGKASIDKLFIFK